MKMFAITCYIIADINNLISWNMMIKKKILK